MRPPEAIITSSEAHQVAVAGTGATIRAGRRPSCTTAASPSTAANDSHNPGTARFPVRSIRYVQIAGVKPPKIAVARLNATEKPAVRMWLGMISVRYGYIAPL